jgi:hypothetical protein
MATFMPLSSPPSSSSTSTTTTSPPLMSLNNPSSGSSTIMGLTPADQSENFATTLFNHLTDKDFSLLIVPSQFAGTQNVSTIIQSQNYTALISFKNSKYYTVDFGKWLMIGNIAPTRFTREITVLMPLVHFALEYSMIQDGNNANAPAAQVYWVNKNLSASKSFYVSQIPSEISVFSECEDTNKNLCPNKIYKWLSTPASDFENVLYFSKKRRPKFGSVAGLKSKEKETYTVFFTSSSSGTYQFHIGSSGMYSLSIPTSHHTLIAPLVALGKALLNFDGYVVYATCSDCSAGVKTGNYKIVKSVKFQGDIPLKGLFGVIEIGATVVGIGLTIVVILFMGALLYFGYKIIKSMMSKSSSFSSPSPVSPSSYFSNAVY